MVFGIKSVYGVGILVDKEFVDLAVEVRRKIDCIMAIKVVVRSEILNMVSVYTPQIGLAEDDKNQFWEDLDFVIQHVPQSEKLSWDETLMAYWLSLIHI